MPCTFILSFEIPQIYHEWRRDISKNRENITCGALLKYLKDMKKLKISRVAQL